MDNIILKEVQQCLGDERLLYHYYDDKFAVDMLLRMANKQTQLSIRERKQSQWAPMLNRT